MARVEIVGRVGMMLAFVLLGACFSSRVLTGSPCVGEGSCGDELACIDNFCKPAECDGNPECEPFKKSCGAGVESDCVEVGARACFYADEEKDAGYCALTCDKPEQCPKGDGDTEKPATPACVDSPISGGAESESAKVCALDCGEGRVCPPDMHCANVTLEGMPRALCLSGAAAMESG